MSQTVVRDRSAESQGRSLSQSTILVLIASGVSQAAVAVTYLLVARSTGPQEFGRVMAVVSLVLSAVGLLEFGTSTLLTREIASRRMLLSEAFHGLFSRMIVMSVVAVVLAGGLRVLDRASTTEAVVLGLLAMTMTLSTGLQGIMRGLGRVQASSWLGAADKCAGFCVVVADLGWHHRASGLSLMLGLMVGPGVVSLYMLLWLFSGRRLQRLRVIHPYKGAFSFGLTASVTSVQTLDTTAIASLAGTEAAGQFGAVSRWVAPLNLIVAAFAQAAFPALAADRTTRVAFRRLMGGLWILGLAWAAAAATALLSPWLVGWLLGAAYRHSAPVLSLMALATVPAATSQIALTLLQARGDEKRAAARITGAVVLQLALVSLGSVVFGALGAAAAILLTQGLLAAVLIKRVHSLLADEGRDAPKAGGRAERADAAHQGDCRWKLIELDGGGHRLWYVSLLLRRISELDSFRPVQLITRPGVPKISAWEEHVRPWQHVLEGGGTTSLESRLSILREAAAERSAIIIPDADRWLPLIALARFTARRSLTGSILLMRPNPEANWSSWRRHLVKAVLLCCLRLVHPHLRVFNLVATDLPGRQARILDPIEFAPSGHGRDEWLRLHGLDPAYKWLVVLGEISERKCVGTLATALGSPTAREAGWRLLIVGNTADEPLIAALASKAELSPGQITCRRSFLTDVEFDTWVAHADAVSVLYRNEGSSGVLLKCWAAGTTVLAGGSRAVLDATKALDLNGVVVDELSPESVIAALTRIVLPASSRMPPEPLWQHRTEVFACSLLGLELDSLKVGMTSD